MKKLLIVIIVFLFIGCEQNALNYYQESAIKTDEINRAKSSLILDLEIDWQELMVNEAKDLTELLKEVTYASESEFDRETNEKITRQYLGTPLMGFDTVIYNNKGDEYIKLPFVGKYLKLENLFNSETLDLNVYNEAPISEASIDAIEKAWLALVEEDDVVNLGNEVIDTPEGEVKVKKFIVTFSHQQVINFLNQILDIMAGDETFRSEITNYPTYVIENGEMKINDTDYEIDVDLIIEEMRLWLDDLVVNEFKMVTYIDIDQYIISSNYLINLSFVGAIGDYINGIRFDAKYQMYDLHEPIAFEFPKVTEKNETDLETLLDTLEDQLNFIN